jgi:hypothetical protein
LHEVSANIFNNMDNPKNWMQTVKTDYTRYLYDKLYENPIQIQNIINENKATKNQVLSFPSSSSSFSSLAPSSFSNLPFSLIKKEEEDIIRDISDDETDTEIDNGTDTDIIPENPLAAVQENNYDMQKKEEKN